MDGTTHLVSDWQAGIAAGFRYTNDWLVALTGGRFSDTFYIGDAWGSFNSWMRLISGALFGIALVGWMFPLLETTHAAASSASPQVST